MLALVLVGALVAQAVGAPTNCAEFCDDQQTTGSYGQSRSSYSSYAKSSYAQGSSLSGATGLGSTGARLENFDQNVIGSTGLDRPGNWRDEKHYITNDGRGEMNYRAGQTVTDNGYSKFAEHSYRYGSHDNHKPNGNTKVLSTDEFERELQNMRTRISSFMGNFHMGVDSTMNANLLQDFNNKASLISSQMNNVCNQVDFGSSMYQEMQQMMQQFQRDVEQRQREMEAMILQSSTSTTNTQTHGSIHHYPSRPTTQYAPIGQYPTRPTVDEYTLIKQQQVEEKIKIVQDQVSNFYKTFNRPDANLQYVQDLNAQVDTITQKLNELRLEAIQNESVRVRIDSLRSQFESYVSHIRTHIQEIERRNREDEVKRKELALILEQEKIRQQEEARIRLLQIEEERRQQQLEEERRQQQLEEERRQQQLEEERRQQQLEEERRQQQLEEERRQQQLEEERLQKLEERQRLQKLFEEKRAAELRLREEEERQREERNRVLLQQQVQKPQMTSTMQVSQSYQHSIKSQVHGGNTGTSGSSVHSKQDYTRPELVIQPHVDLTAAMNRLQQDLNRLQTEVNNFNIYTMRLTASNSETVVSEAEKQAEELRQRINSLCETSSKYQNTNIQTSAEELKRRFEKLFSSFQSQAASYSSQSAFSASSGYASESSYGATGSYSSVKAPTIANVEYEHSKSTEIEAVRRPVSAQRYSSGSGYNAASGYRSSGSYGSSQQAENPLKSGVIELGQGSSQQAECVETYAGQPCIQQTRYRRNAGEYGPFYDLNHQMPDYTQQHQPIFDDFTEYGRNGELGPYAPQLADYTQQHVEPVFDDLTYGYNDENIRMPENSGLEDYSERARPAQLPREYQPIRHEGLTRQTQRPSQPQSRNLRRGHQIEDLTRRENIYDDYYRRQNPSDQDNHPVSSQDSDLAQQTQDLNQQYVNFVRNGELDLLEKSRSQKFNVSHHTRDQIQQPGFGNLEIERNAETFRGYKNNFNNSDLTQHEVLNDDKISLVLSAHTFEKSKPEEETEEPPRVRPLAVFGKSESKLDSEPFTFQKNVFNDYPEPSETSELTENPQQARSNAADLTLENSGFNDYPNHSQKSELTENSSHVQQISTSGKVGSSPKSETFTLQQSGFNDYVETDGKIESTENTRQRIQPITIFGKHESAQEHLTLQNSGFNDYPNQNEKRELNNEPERVRPLASVSLELGQQTESLTQQQNSFDSSYSRNEKFNKPKRYDNSDLTQQSAGQIDFGSESQLERQFSSQGPSKPELYGIYSDVSRQRGQQIENLSQHQHHPQSIKVLDSNHPNGETESDTNQSGKDSANTEYQGFEQSISTVRPTLRPAPKPVPRYTRPWQVSQSQNVLKQNEQKPIESENASIEQSNGLQNQTSVDKHSASLRGDLPGISEPSTTPSVVEEKPEINDNQKTNLDYDSRQQYEKVNLNQDSQSTDLQKPRNEWSQNNKNYNQYGQEYHHTPQSIQQNYEYSQQQSNYYSQHNRGIEIGQKPLTQPKISQLDYLSNFNKYNQEQGSMYQFHEQQTGNLEIQKQKFNNNNQNTRQFEHHQLGFNTQTDFSQQIQDPSFETQSSATIFAQQQEKASSLEQENIQRVGNGFVEGVIPLDEAKPINAWSETEPISNTPHTFWKRIGHKLSNSFNKAKQKAKAIFGVD